MNRLPLRQSEGVSSPIASGRSQGRGLATAVVRICVTGVNGFIGAALATAAHVVGHDVVGVDLSTGGRTLPPGVNEIRGDITSPATWWGALGRIDVLVHCAAIHRSDQIAERPVGSIAVNLRGTSVLLEMAAASGVQRFVHLSSAKVYGEPLAFPSSEDDLLNPVEPYGLAKAVSEQSCTYFATHSEMRCIAVRPFSVYGPGQDLRTGYIGQLLEGWRAGHSVTFSGNPDYLRDFVHIDDVVSMCLAAAQVDQPFSVVNAGSGVATSLRDLVDAFGSLCGDPVDVNYVPARAGTITRTLADARRGRQLLGRSPISLRAGLLDTLQAFAPASFARG